MVKISSWEQQLSSVNRVLTDACRQPERKKNLGKNLANVNEIEKDIEASLHNDVKKIFTADAEACIAKAKRKSDNGYANEIKSEKSFLDIECDLSVMNNDLDFHENSADKISTKLNDTNDRDGENYDFVSCDLRLCTEEETAKLLNEDLKKHKLPEKEKPTLENAIPASSTGGKSMKAMGNSLETKRSSSINKNGWMMKSLRTSSRGGKIKKEGQDLEKCIHNITNTTKPGWLMEVELRSSRRKGKAENTMRKVTQNSTKKDEQGCHYDKNEQIDKFQCLVKDTLVELENDEKNLERRTNDIELRKHEERSYYIGKSVHTYCDKKTKIDTNFDGQNEDITKTKNLEHFIGADHLSLTSRTDTHITCSKSGTDHVIVNMNKANSKEESSVITVETEFLDGMIHQINSDESDEGKAIDDLSIWSDDAYEEIDDSGVEVLCEWDNASRSNISSKSRSFKDENDEDLSKSSSLGTDIENEYSSDSDEQSIKWEKPEWVTKNVLRTSKRGHMIRKEGKNLAREITNINVRKGEDEIEEKKLGWDKPDWTKKTTLAVSKRGKKMKLTGNLARPISTRKKKSGYKTNQA